MERVEGAFAFIRLDKGMLESNTYILWENESKFAAVIDPGNKASDIQKIIEDRSLDLKYIVLTHAHYDHIYYLDALKNLYPNSITISHSLEVDSFDNPVKNGSLLFGKLKKFQKPEATVEDAYIIEFLNEEVEVIHTPGHTKGGITLRAGKFLFTGDTLFYGSYGRTDLGDGDDGELAASLTRLLSMDEDLIVLPGHGDSSTIGNERRINPFMGA